MNALEFNIDHKDFINIRKELISAIKSIKPISVILIGSYSRNEYWRGGAFYSDVEFYFIVEDYSVEINKTDFTKIDISIIKKIDWVTFKRI